MLFILNSLAHVQEDALEDLHLQQWGSLSSPLLSEEFQVNKPELPVPLPRGRPWKPAALEGSSLGGIF